MKKFFTLACAAIVSLGASAQLISSNTISTVKEESDNYSRFNISYNSLDTDNITEDKLSGVSLGWTKGISVSKQLPLFVEIGLGASYHWGSEEVTLTGYDYDYYGGYDTYEYSFDIDHKFLSLSIPVSVTYKYEITDGLNIAPYLGVFFRGNLLGESSADDADINWFDDYEDDGLEAERFSYGYQIGVGVEFNKLYLGVEYAKDMNEIVEDCKASNLKLSVGVVF